MQTQAVGVLSNQFGGLRRTTFQSTSLALFKSPIEGPKTRNWVKKRSHFDVLLPSLLPSCENLGELLNLLARMSPPMTGDCKMQLHHRPDAGPLFYEVSGPLDASRQMSVDKTLRSLVAFARQNTESAWRPIKVCLRQPNCDRFYRLELEQQMGCTIEYGQPYSGLWLEPSDLRLSLTQEEKEANRQAMQLAGEPIEANSSPGFAPNRPSVEFIRHAEAVALECLREGKLSTDNLAKRMGMSRRTFQRRLAEQGNSYRELAANVRLELAKRYIQSTNTRISEIAEQVGFATAAGLHRAFRRHYGKTPAEFRRFEAE